MEKTLGLLLMILLGVLLQRKLAHANELKGVRIIILSLALPATIFVALLSVNLTSELLILPLLGLGINFLLIGIFALSVRLFPSLNGQRRRTLLMLLPSLAPGLSCFPFISEYLGEGPLALAALLDVGNKIFVLIILYLLAMRWYLKINEIKNLKEDGKIKDMLLQMLGEPINLIMILALIMLALGWNLDTLPSSISTLFVRLSSIMAPLVLLFIGLSVKVQWRQLGLIAQLLTWRAGVTLLFSAAFIWLVPNLSPTTVLLAIVFPLSSVSFWPFAHMNLIAEQEKDKQKTFDMDFALAVLAFSLPFSSVLTMAILSFPQQSSNPMNVSLLGALMFLVAVIPQSIKVGKRILKGQSAI